jgi:hypothetical protein
MLREFINPVTLVGLCVKILKPFAWENTSRYIRMEKSQFKICGNEILSIYESKVNKWEHK